MSKVFIRIKDKETGQESKEISIEKLIFDQQDIEFQFGKWGDDNYGTLPYSDFLFYQEDYEVMVRIGSNRN